MKKVLIITYYWPPMGGGGVQRWLKFSRYLRDFGWEPVIYTPSNADVANLDESLVKEVPENVEVIRRDIWEPFDLYKKFVGKSKDEKVQPGFLQESDSSATLQKLSVWIRGNFFIPDAKKFWIKPSVKYLKEYVRSNNIKAVISTGPPHSNHLIALGLKKSLNVKWLADFRDPWTNIDYYNKLILTSLADKKHRKMEREVLNKADEVVTVSWSWAKDFQESTGKLPLVVTNGYDPEDFNLSSESNRNKKFTITHIGSLNKDRNPYSFWKAVDSLIKEGVLNSDNFLIRLIGPTDMSVFDEIKNYQLNDMVEHIQHLQHKDVIHQIVGADILLLPLNDTPNIDGVIPGKLYEYLASRRPICCIGKKDGDAAKIIIESEAGEVFAFDDSVALVSYLKRQMEIFNNNSIPDNSVVPEKYSRKNLAGQIAQILNDITD